jgi:hypothetical protein
MNKNRIIPAVGISLLLPLWVWAQSPSSGPAPAAVPALDAAPAAATASGPGGASTPAAGAGAAPAPAPEPPTEAELTLDEAAGKVKAIAAVAAELVQSVEMLRQKFQITGKYRKAPGGRLFLHLVVSGLPGSKGEMKQVSNGETIWDFQQLLEHKYYRKVTLGPIYEKLKSSDLDAEAREQVLTRLGIEGPDVLLVGLRKAIRWDQREEGTLDGRPVWILRGTWKDRQGLLGPNQQPLPPTAPLPSYIPSQATLYIGKEDGWPYKVRLAGRQPTVLLDTRRIGPDGRPIGPRSAIQTIEPSVVVLAYSVVSLDPKFQDSDFDFPAPEGVRVDDSTEAVLSEIDQMVQMRNAQKKAEAAKAEEPVLDQQITLPRTNPSAEGAPPPPTAPPLTTPK